MVTLVDDEDFERVDQFKWHVGKDKNIYYAKRNIAISEEKHTLQKLHRFIINITDPKIQIDHKNGDSLDNRKENLRLATGQENSRNRKKRNDNTSGYKGVSWNRERQKFVASIKFNSKILFLGYFDTAEEASSVYETKALKEFGEFYRKE